MAHILVIDDEAAIRSAIRLALEQAGHRVHEASEGRAAERILRQRPIDVVITDILMPERDGLEVIRKVRQAYPDIKLLAISGGGDHLAPEYVLDTAQSFGATRILPKPFDLNQLTRIVENMVSG